MKSILKYYNYFLLGLLIIVINLTYHPLFHVARIDADDVEVKSVLSKYVPLITACLVLPNIRLKQWVQNVEIIKFIRYIIPLLFIAAIIHMLFPTSGIIADVKYFIIPLLFFILGNQLKFSENHAIFFSFLYVGFALFTGISQVLTNIGAFVIMEQYMVSAKNSMACIFAVGIVISLFWALSDIKKCYKLIFLFTFFLLFAVLLTIRGRAGILASVVSCFFVLYKYIKNNNINPSKMFFRVLGVIVIGIILLAESGKLSFISDYIYASLFTTHSGDVTSGRVDRNIDAINIISDNLLMGRLGVNIQVEWVHNYILRILSDYGILIGMYFLIPYFYLLKRLYLNIKDSKHYSIMILGNVALIVPFVISLFEPTYPYSPGTTIMFPFFLLGVSYSYKSLQEQ